MAGSLTKDKQIQILEARVAEYMEVLSRVKALVYEARIELGEPRPGKFPTFKINFRARVLTLLQAASLACDSTTSNKVDSKSLAEELLGPNDEDVKDG